MFRFRTAIILIAVSHLPAISQGCLSGLLPPGVDPASLAPQLLGGTATAQDLADNRDFVPISDSSALECYFDQPCNWGSDGPDENTWYKISGVPDDVMWKAYTGSDIIPEGDFSLHSKYPGKESDWLMSEPIQCQKNEGALEFKYWLMPPATFKVCAVGAGADETTDPNGYRRTLWCSADVTKAAPLTPGPGQLSTVTVPPIEEPFMLAFVPVTDGGFVAIDEPFYQTPSVLCNEPAVVPTVTPDPFPATDVIPTTPAIDAQLADNCRLIECDFDSGSTCNYFSMDQKFGASKQFRLQNAPIKTGNGNGINWPHVVFGQPNPRLVEEGSYAGTVLRPNEKAILMSQGIKLRQPMSLRMKYSDATPGQQIKVALNTLKNVIWSSEGPQTDREWKLMRIPLPQNTERIFIIGDNFGNALGSAAVDSIELLFQGNIGSGRSVCKPQPSNG